MDFNFSEDQNAIRVLANQIFGDRATDEFLLSFSREGATYDEPLWQTLAEQGLLGIAVPESAGGSGGAPGVGGTGSPGGACTGVCIPGAGRTDNCRVR